VDLSQRNFATLVGERFIATPSLGGTPLELTLGACEPSPHVAPGGEAFSLRFHAPGPDHLPQQIFTLAQGEDAIELFLVPLGPEPEGMAYEAVVNRTAAAP
jgi:hypothetical protein